MLIGDGDGLLEVERLLKFCGLGLKAVQFGWCRCVSDVGVDCRGLNDAIRHCESVASDDCVLCVVKDKG